MEKIYKLSDTNYFENDDIEYFEYKKINLENVNYSSEDATYKFFINDTNSNILYSEGYLVQTLKIVKNDGSSIGHETVSFVNGGGLIKSCKLVLGTTEIEAHNGYSEILHQILGLTHFTPDYLRTSEPSNMLFYQDTYDSYDKLPIKYNGELKDDTKLTDFLKNLRLNDHCNKGFADRSQYTSESKIVEIAIPLKCIFDFFKGYRKVITGFQVRFEFERNNSKTMLYTNQNEEYKAIVESMSLKLPYVRFKNEANVIFNQEMLNERIEIKWNQHKLILSNTIPNHSSGSYAIPSTSDEVLSLFVVPQYSERNENYKKNNLIFDNLDMKQCWLNVNGTKYPTDTYHMDFNSNEYEEVYRAFLKEGLNTKTFETGSLVSHSDFKKLYPIICFDLSNHVDYTNLSNLNLEFNWRLRNNTNKSFVFYFILKERKKCVINMKNQNITMINSLKN